MSRSAEERDELIEIASSVVEEHVAVVSAKSRDQLGTGDGVG